MSASDGAVEHPHSYRGLKAAVIVMGVMLVLGFILVLGMIIYRLVHPAQDEEIAAQASFQEIAMPGDAELVDSKIGEGRLVLTVREANGAITLVIIDLDTARLVGQLRLAPGRTAHAAL
jgi:hypothetical protein